MVKNLSTMRLFYFAAIIVGIVAGGLWLHTFIPSYLGSWLIVGMAICLIGLAVASIQSASIDKTLKEDWGERTLAGLFGIGLMAELFIWGPSLPLAIGLFFGSYATYWFFFAE